MRDLARMEAFYADLLGLPVVARHADGQGAPRAVWLGLEGGGFLALERCDGASAPRPFHDTTPGLHLLALSVAPGERDALATRLAQAGFATVARTRFTFYVLDPEGNRLGLSHHPQEPAGGT